MLRRGNDPERSTFWERAVGYVFPFLLIAVEWALRSAFALETEQFMGPTLAATGIGMVIPLFASRSTRVLPPMPHELQDYLEKNPVIVESRRSRSFTSSTVFMAVLLTIGWVFALYIADKQSGWSFWIFPVHYYIGFASFLVGVVMTEIKEII